MAAPADEQTQADAHRDMVATVADWLAAILY
jgi:hypothetical protein